MNRLDTLRPWRLAGLLLLVVTAGCHLEDSLPIQLEPSASARVMVVLPRTLLADSVTEVRATLTPAEGVAASERLPGDGALWQGVVRGIASGRARRRAPPSGRRRRGPGAYRRPGREPGRAPHCPGRPGAARLRRCARG
ncbi:hypothetical protein ACLEPN_32960, partial [Myxococcus sp. 1LA]